MKSALQIYLSYRKYTPVALQTSVSKQLGMIVVIPCYNEPDLLATLQSLYEAERPVCHVEVLVVVNSAEDTSLSILDQNRKTLQEIAGFGQNVNTDCFRVVTLHQTGQPPKYAGVGLARKAGMDEAVSRFATIGNECGVIISMDADCLVASDYFVQIEQQFCLNPRLAVATIRFEHTLPRGDARLREAMVQYELYLRYYKQALCFIGFPYAYYTIGSAFVVRADAYCRSGGMGRQQSGEDFYFLQKVFQQGKTLELNVTTVYPSPRLSDRVPYGTGPSLLKMMSEQGDMQKYAYAWESFLCLRILFEKREPWYLLADRMTGVEAFDFFTTDLPYQLSAYLEKANFIKSLFELRHNCSSLSVFSKRFFDWYNGLRVLQSLNVLQEVYPSRPVTGEVYRLIKQIWRQDVPEKDSLSLLLFMRARN